MESENLDNSIIASHVLACLERWGQAAVSFTEADVNIQQKLQHGSILDQAGRFRLWSSNIGAHKYGKSSLDYRLREASHIQGQVVELLQKLAEVLDETIELTSGERKPWEDFSDSESDLSEDEGHARPVPELEQLVSNMAEINTCLMRLSIVIRNPAPHDQFKKSTLIDMSHYETFDVDHVRGKFPQAKEHLVRRLGQGISRRRHYLQYRAEHRSKLEHGIAQAHAGPASQHVATDVTAPTTKIQSTVASSIPSVFKLMSSTPIEIETTLYEDALSQTSYASSMQNAAKLRPPPLPLSGQDGNPFECILCFRFISAKDTVAWHKHVYRDLQPYMCTFEDCRLADHMYESQSEWFNHETIEHRKQWECLEGCNRKFDSAETFRLHLGSHHSNIPNDERLEDFLSACERRPPMDTEVSCVLCSAKLPSLAQLRRHLGKHQQELSLFAIPYHVKRVDLESDEESLADGDSRSKPSTLAHEDSPIPTETACQSCKKTFTGDEWDSLEALRVHMAEDHVESAPSDLNMETTRDSFKQHLRQEVSQTQRDSHVTWTWSAKYNDYYYITYDAEGRAVYNWSKAMPSTSKSKESEIRAETSDPERRRLWKETTYPSETTYEQTVPVLPVPRDVRQREPNFLGGTPEQGWYDRLDQSYYMRTAGEAREFFRIGRVFCMLYTETAAATARIAPDDETFTVVRFGGTAHTQIRRFVIVSVRKGFIYACAISTYRNQGTLKRGCDPSEHAVVYNTGIDPETCYLAGERERGLIKEPIEVAAADPSSYLVKESRIRFGKIYTIEMNVKVKDLGLVTEGHRKILVDHWQYEEKRYEDD